MLISLGSPPSDAETDAWHAVATAAHVLDLPAAVPEPSRAETAGKLRLPPVGGRNIHLAVTMSDNSGNSGDSGDSYDGVASLLLFTDEHLRHTAFLDAFVVRPEGRRRGIGATLWSATRDRLMAEGATSVCTMLELGGAGEAFVDSLGFTNVLPLGWYVLRVRQALDEARQSPLPEGLRLISWTGVVPDDYAETFALAHQAMRDLPSWHLDVADRTWNVERVRAGARRITDRGGVVLTSAVLDTAHGDAVVAYTELVLNHPAATRALQYDTVVAPASRSRGLGRAVKSHALLTLREQHPHVREISTTVADENAAMLALNERLGYRRERPAGLFRAKL